MVCNVWTAQQRTRKGDCVACSKSVSGEVIGSAAGLKNSGVVFLIKYGRSHVKLQSS